MARRVRGTTIAVVVVVAVLALLAVGSGRFAAGPPAAVATSSPAVAGAGATRSPGGSAQDPVRVLFEQQRSGVEVQGTGVVSRILPDDDDGSRHQKFLLTTPSGVSILIAHNIDIAPRLDGLSKGDRVDFLGDYEWSDKGGTVHWTHHDPSGRHQAGWLRWNGRTFS
ncbi:hypothetical protein RL72_00378 [Microbacterium azadirachtae]|uniref:DUF3465 domain-containing protein n=1 Tax=Microbacterium azadirachtae TaxID=582680 RepID=A0A0F0LBW6_9MICO|nr:DUF3465 domain-containing protein [Microbacterium azadirachtae]KJL29061.1 hypothetical protein RL72_00378 [Microbacterium azadirachtae]